MTRPLQQTYIDDLERIFAEAVDLSDPEKARQVGEELAIRASTRPRNLKLAEAVKLFLEEMEISAEEGAGEQDEESASDEAFYDPQEIDYDDPSHWVREAPRARPADHGSTPSQPRAVVDRVLHQDLPPPKPPRTETPSRKPHRVGRTPPQPPKSISRDEASRVLRAWMALEVLSPASVYRRPADLADGVERRIAELDERDVLPWRRGEPGRPSKRLFYHLVLGAIRMEEATSALLASFEDLSENTSPTLGYAPLSIVTLDNKGVPVGVDGVVVSSFAWGLPRALTKDLRSLSDWPKHEEALRDVVLGPLSKTDDDGQALPVDREMIASAFAKLTGALSIPAELVVAPHFAIRVYHYWRAEEPPEPPPMSSFFLKDLSLAAQQLAKGAEPPLLRRYLGMSNDRTRADVRRNDPVIDELLAPKATPLGAWPSKEGHPLVLLQQAAVNASARLDLLSVNGPPGTGKTTLLRDLIAAKVVERACRLVAFDVPASAFAKTTHTQQINLTQCRLHQVDDRLKGFEIVVASSNNKAVENVSEALPQRTAVKFAADIDYFTMVSDNVARGLSEDEKNSAKRRPDPPNTTWGLAGAVLGNSRNRYAFSQCAWKDFDFGLRSLLMELSGAPQRIDIKDPTTGRIIEKRVPRIVEAMAKGADKLRWANARQAFKTTHAQLAQRIAALVAGRSALATTGDDVAKLAAARRALASAEEEWATANLGASAIEQALASAEWALRNADAQWVQAVNAKPKGLLAIFKTEETKAWRARVDELNSVRTRAAIALGDAKARQSTRQFEINRAQAKRAQAAAHEAALARAVGDPEEALSKARAVCGDLFADAAFFERAPEDLQRDTAWFDEETQRLRRLLFEQAMDVHRRFIESAAGPIRNNLDLLFRTFYGKSAWSGPLRERMGDLWATFFLVIPALSTTFASIERMLGYLPADSIGLLLLDESGQATPQSAVGAIMRSKKVIVVGDPLQLPPVVQLPTALCDLVARECDIDGERFVAASRLIPLVASVQTLADSACELGTHLETLDAWIGLPLVVHRRCADPMFSLSNQISYEGLMVNGRGARPSQVRDVLGPSRWIDVKPGRCTDKWSEAEGEALLAELHRLAAANLEAPPDIYIISPFRVVAQHLRQLLVKQDFLRQWTDDPRRWIKDRVGTVYTVQGREADTVFLVLGAGQPERRRARQWAGDPPNQLNVAITRAKENLYVIGNRFEWASAGHVAELERMLPPHNR